MKENITNQNEIDQSDLEEIITEKEQIVNYILDRLVKKGFNKEEKEKIIPRENKQLYERFTKACYDIANRKYNIRLSFKDNPQLNTIDEVAEHIIKEDYNIQCQLVIEEAETIFGY